MTDGIGSLVPIEEVDRLLFRVTVGQFDFRVRLDDQAVSGSDGETHLEQGTTRSGPRHLIHHCDRHQS